MLSPRFITYTSIALHIDIRNVMVSKSWRSLGLWDVWIRDCIEVFQNIFPVSRTSFIADTIGRLNAVKHFPYMSSKMRRLESIFFLSLSLSVTSQTCESFIELRCRMMNVHLFHCRQSSSTLIQERVFQPAKRCSLSSSSSGYSHNGVLAGCL